MRGCAPDKTQAQPYKVNVVISWLELNGTQQLHQGIFVPQSPDSQAFTMQLKPQKTLKSNRSSVVFNFGSVVPVLMSLCAAQLQDNLKGQ